MKKGLTALFLSLTMALTFMLCACGSPRASDINDFLYEAKDGEITITGYTGKDLEVVIPDVIDNRPVKYIGNSAFEEYDMTSIYVPEGVEMIHENAFRHCNMLENISLPNSLKCFYRENNGGDKIPATAYGSLEYTKWFTNQPDGILYNNNLLLDYKGEDDLTGTLEVKDGTVSILAKAFDGQYGIDTITLPNSVKYIGDYAFTGCSSVKSLSVPDGCVVGTRVLGEFSDFKVVGNYTTYIDGVEYKGSPQGGLSRVE